MDKQTKIKFNIIAIVSIIIFCMALTPIKLQNDTFYTIKIGEHILQNGIDMQDPFSIHELPYTYPHWLYDVGIYLIYNVGGMLGIYISTVILACILGLTIYLTNRKIVKNDVISFVLTLGAMCILKSFIAARAQLVTFILFALAIYFIEQYLATEKKKYLIGLIIIPIIIANVHLAVWPFYFVIFLPYIAEYLIVKLIDSNIFLKIPIWLRKQKIKMLSKQQGKEKKTEELEQKNQEAKDKLNRYILYTEEKRKHPYRIRIEKRPATKWLILVCIICLFTGLLTPLGDTPYTYLVKTMQGNTTQNINEHLPMVLINNKNALAIIAIVLALLIFTDTKIRLSDLFLLGGLIVLALMSQRQLSMLTLLGIIPLNRMICELINKYDPHGTEEITKLITSGFGVVITLLLVILTSVLYFRPQAGDTFINKKSYPVDAAEWINQNLDVENIRLYNEYNYGSYLLYQNIPVFIDSRADLYTPEFNGDKDKNIFSDFLNVSGLNVYYEKIFDKYDITHLLIPDNAKITIFLDRDENYKELYKDDNFIIYERLTNDD